jgi:ISXO2-like transposase domain
MVEQESLLITDGHRTLMNLKNFEHQVVVVTHNAKNALDIFKPVHRIISNAKAVIRSTYHGVSDKHRQKYLDEYCYRLNRRFCEHVIFGKLVSACVLAKPISYAELTL